MTDEDDITNDEDNSHVEEEDVRSKGWARLATRCNV